MGRKKQLQLGTAPKRRTVLQLDDNRGTGNNNRVSSPVPVKQGNSLGLISHYGDDSDEEEEESEPAKPKTEIDLKVADFLAEIEALDTPTGSGSNTPREETPEDDAPAPAADTAAAAWDAPPATQPTEEIGEWQELLDPNTNCMYFWNTVTNQVSWELPQSLQALEEKAEPVNPTANDPVNHYADEDADIAADVAEVPPQDATDKEVEEVMETQSAPAFPLFGPNAPKLELEANSSSSSSPLDELVKEEKPDVSEEYGIFVKGEPLMLSKEKEYDIFAVKSPVKEMKEADDGGEEDEDEEAAEEEDDEGGSMETDEKEDCSTLDGQPLEEEDEENEENEEVNDSALEFDEDDIDAQLEQALEQKKAELRDLDDIEPDLSEDIPTITTAPKRKQEEISEESIYTENGEINLLPFKKKRMEMLKGQKQSLMEDKATQCGELDLTELANEMTKQKNKEAADIKCEVAAITSDLRSKLGFLGMSRKDLNKFHILLIEIETRVQDWRDGILDGKHLMNKLETANWELELYEREAAPPDWTCAWDRTHKLYYYVNNSTGDSQWEYPLEALEQHKETLGSTVSQEQFVCKDTFNQASSVGGYNTDAKEDDSVNGQKDIPEKSTKERISSESQPDIDGKPAIQSEGSFVPPLPEEPPLPPDIDIPPPPPSSPPPPLPPRPPPDYDSDTEPLPPGVSPPPSPTPENPPVPSEPLPQQVDSALIVAKPVVRYVNPVTVINPAVMMAPSYSAVPVQPTMYAQPTVTQQPLLPVKKEPLPTKTKTKKTKKVKKSLANKKLPMILVEKWKQIKEEQEKEEEVVEEEEEDMETMTQRRIKEWKESQFTTGKASYNANFEMIKGDWRERLKRKNTKS